MYRSSTTRGIAMAMGEVPAADGMQIPLIRTPPPDDPPPDTEPSVSIVQPTGILAGVPVTINVLADRGAHWRWDAVRGEWQAIPKVTYTGFRFKIDTGQEVTGGQAVNLTFPQPGARWVMAVGSTAEGRDVSSQPLNVQVAAAPFPPVFTVVQPVDNSMLVLN